VPDKVRLSGEVRSVLKSGGLFAIVNWHARPREETIVLGEPRGPATEFRIDPEIVLLPRMEGLEVHATMRSSVRATFVSRESAAGRSVVLPSRNRHLTGEPGNLLCS
jgi:hypothetical protein